MANIEWGIINITIGPTRTPRVGAEDTPVFLPNLTKTLGGRRGFVNVCYLFDVLFPPSRKDGEATSTL